MRNTSSRSNKTQKNVRQIDELMKFAGDANKIHPKIKQHIKKNLSAFINKVSAISEELSNVMHFCFPLMLQKLLNFLHIHNNSEL